MNISSRSRFSLILAAALLLPALAPPSADAQWVTGWRCTRCGATGTGPKPYSCPQCGGFSWVWLLVVGGGVALVSFIGWIIRTARASGGSRP